MHTFNPPDHELTGNFLNNRIIGNYDLEAWIKELNICDHEPEDFPGLVSKKSSHTWHFISRVEKLKGTCGRTKRSTKTGHWKITGRNCNVKDVYGNIIVFKKFLVFQENKKSSSSSSSIKQNKSSWTIHEFHSSIQHPNKDYFVLCKLMKKTRTPRSDAIADASPVVTYPNIISHSPFQSQNDNIVVEDYDEEFFHGVEIFFPQLQSTHLIDDQPQYPNDSLPFEDFYFVEPTIQENRNSQVGPRRVKSSKSVVTFIKFVLLS